MLMIILMLAIDRHDDDATANAEQSGDDSRKGAGGKQGEG